MRSLTLLMGVLLLPFSVFGSVLQSARVCVFEAAQANSWSITCEGRVAESGLIMKGETPEAVISLHLSSLINAGFTVQACTGFSNNPGIRCVLTR